MSKQVSNQLLELTFINAASLPYAHVDVDGNTLFSGRNGAGKTTVLRAVLYFYGAYRNEALGISRKKKRFEEFYFARSNSYLVYRFSNDFGNVLAIVYKTTGLKVKYRFLKEPEDASQEQLKELFFNDGVAKESKELFNAFLGAGYELSPVINSSKEYKSVLYGQDRRLITYSFYQANAEYEQIAKTLSNIFVNSKLDSGSIKKSLAASINGFAPIDLDQMEQMIESFWERYEDIQNFQKNEATIIEAIGSLAELETHNEAIKQNLAQLQANYSLKQESIAVAEKELDTAQVEITQSKQDFDAIQHLYGEQKEHYLRNSAVLEAHVKEAGIKKKQYENSDIKAKIEAYGNLETLQEKYHSIEKQKSLLTQELLSVTQQFEALKSQAMHSVSSQKQSYIEQLNSLEREFNSELSIVMAQEQEKLQAFDKDKESKLEQAREELLSVKEEKQKLYYAYERLQKEPFLQEELQAAIEARRFSHESMQDLENQMNLLKKDLELIFGQVSQKEQHLSQTLDVNRERYMNTKNALVKEKEALVSKLEHFEHSLFGFIKAQNLPQEKELLKVLKDEVLFSTHLNPKTLDGKTLLGIDLDFSALPEVDFDVALLRERLESVESKEETLTRNYEESKASLENTTRNVLNALKREEQALRQNLGNAATQLPQLERATLESNEAVERLTKDATELKNSALQEAVDALEKIDKLYTDKVQAFKSQEDSFTAKKEAMIIASKEIKSEREQAKNNAKAVLEEKIANLQADLERKLSEMKAQEDAALQEGGVDTKLLQSYEDELAQLSADIGKIKAYANEVKEFEIDEKRLFGTLTDRELELKTLKEHYNKQTSDFTKTKYEYDEKAKELSRNFDQHKRTLGKIKSEQNAYDTFMDSGFGESLDMNAVEAVPANEERLTDLIESIKEVSYNKERTSATLGKKLRRVFDKLSVNSSFNISRPRSDDEVEMILAARALQSFVLDNKIDTFKTEVARLYSTTLHHIASETTELLKADGEIRKIVDKINKTLSDLQGIKVIEKIELKFRASDNPILNLLTSIDELTGDIPYGDNNLFSKGDDKKYHKTVLSTLMELSTALNHEKNDLLSVDDSFVLEFRAIENGHDTGFVSSLDGIGSNGTDVMVKAMVYIAMLSLAREQSSKKDSEVFFHCILDEVGILAPNYLKELINYANAKQIRFLNGAPDEKLVTTYKRLYMLSTNAKHQTMVRRLLAQV